MCIIVRSVICVFLARKQTIHQNNKTRPWQRPRQQSWERYLSPTKVVPEVFAEHLNTIIMYESHIDSHTRSMLVVACRSTASAVEQEAPVREGVVGETVGFPTRWFPYYMLPPRVVNSFNISGLDARLMSPFELEYPAVIQFLSYWLLQ